MYVSVSLPTVIAYFPDFLCHYYRGFVPQSQNSGGIYILRHFFCGTARLRYTIFLFAEAFLGDSRTAAPPALAPDLVVAMPPQVVAHLILVFSSLTLSYTNIIQR